MASNDTLLGGDDLAVESGESRKKDGYARLVKNRTRCATNKPTTNDEGHRYTIGTDWEGQTLWGEVLSNLIGCKNIEVFVLRGCGLFTRQGGDVESEKEGAVVILGRADKGLAVRSLYGTRKDG